MFSADREDNLFEEEGTPFGKGGGLFSGGGALFDDEGGAESRNDLEASVKSRSSRKSGGGDMFGDHGDEDDEDDWMTGSIKKSPAPKEKKTKRKKAPSGSSDALFDALDEEGGGEGLFNDEDTPVSPSPKEKKKKKVCHM